MKHIAFRIKSWFGNRSLAGSGLLLLFVMIAVFAGLTAFVRPASAAPGINKTINFQGKVVQNSGINVADASYNFKFRLYTAATGNTAVPCASVCIWEETKSLTTINGIFQTNLGDVTALPGAVNFNTDNLYIGVVFNGDTEMTPRIRLTSVPYAFNADLLDGLDGSQLVQLSPAAQQTGTINVNGNISSGGKLQANTVDAATTGALVLGSSNATGLTLAKNTTLGTGLTLSLQGNNALNLGSTTAAGGIVFQDGTLNNRAVTISTVGLTASYSLNLPTAAPTAGAQCLQTNVSSTVNLVFGACGASGTFVSLQSGTPGTAETGNFNISGVGIAANFMANSFDTTTFSILNIGASNTASVSIARAGITTTIASNVTVGGNLTFANGATRTINVAPAASGTGNDLALRGGAAGTAGSNGGNILLSGGSGSGSGVRGVVMLDTPAFTTVQNTNCSSDCTIAQTNIDNNAAVIVSATALNVVVAMPDPTYQVAGRLVYVTAANGSNDFTLSINGGGTGNQIAMRQNTSATMIWNGTDWTAAGASSSTTLQAAYDNTLAAAGGAEILLNNTPSSNGLTIRNNAGNPILGSVFEVQSSIGTNLLAVNNNAVEYVANGGAETETGFSTDWGSIGAGTVERNTVVGNVATGQASAQISTPATINTGVRNRLTTGLTPNTRYQVSFTGKLSSGTFTSLDVRYTRNGGANAVSCDIYSTQSLVTNGWSKVTCTFTTDATAATNPYLQIRQTDAVARTFYIDNVSVTLSTISSTPPNVQIGGGIYGGPVTLFTLDRSSSPPVASGNDVYYGSMYYDTTSGRIQCYQANGWGACGSAPDTYVSLNPEYAGAVLAGPGNGGSAGIGTMTAELCSNSSALSINANLCSTGQSLNYYKWTSPQPSGTNSRQTYSIYLSYQLPGGFKQFQSNSTVQLTGRIDNTANAAITYEMFRSEGGAISRCWNGVSGQEETSVAVDSSNNPVANTWVTKGINGDEAGAACGFTTASANNYVIFKINLKAQANATAYVSTLSFTVTNQ